MLALLSHTHSLTHAHAPLSSLKQVQASQRVFEFAGMLSGSVWARQLLFFPDAAWMVQWLAARLPDQRLKDLTQVSSARLGRF